MQPIPMDLLVLESRDDELVVREAAACSIPLRKLAGLANRKLRQIGGRGPETRRLEFRVDVPLDVHRLPV